MHLIQVITASIQLILEFTNKLAVVNSSNAVIDTECLGAGTHALAFNPNNNVYVAQRGSNNVSVIDSSTNSVIDLVPSLGISPVALAVNTFNNATYVANIDSDNVGVIDSATGSVRIQPVVDGPTALAFNPSNNHIYVANLNTNIVSVID